MSCRTATSCSSGSMSKRIELFDALRGVSILLMILHHAAIDLAEAHRLSYAALHHPVVVVLQFIFSSVFIALAGFSSKFSKNNWKRGLQLLAIAYGITLVTSFLPMVPIRFGILHFLAWAILLYALLQPHLDRIPTHVWFWLFLVAYVLYVWVNLNMANNPPHLWMLGIVGGTFQSADYYPLLPWFFLFILGTKLGVATREHRLPAWVYTTHIPFFPAVGRHTLLIYLIHQPILLGILYLISV